MRRVLAGHFHERGLQGGSSLTLTGLTVLLTRKVQDNGPLKAKIIELGGQVVESPLISIQHVSDNLIAEAWLRLRKERLTGEFTFRGIVATSANALVAAEHLLESEEQGFFSPCFVVGERTGRAAAQMGLKVIHPEGVKNALGLATYLCTKAVMSGARTNSRTYSEQPRNDWLLWLRGQMADEAFRSELERHGWIVDDIVCYETILLEVCQLAWAQVSRASRVAVVFYSPSAVQAFVKSSVVHEHPLTEVLTFIAVGETTKAALLKNGLRPNVTASSPTMEAVLDAIIQVNERSAFV